MADTKKFLDIDGVQVLYQLLSLQDYPNNDVLAAVIDAIDDTKADKKDLENIQNQFRNLNEFVKPISAAGMFSDDSALKLTISEMLLNYNKKSLHGLTYYKVSNITPSIAELQNGFNIIVSVAGDAPEDAALDFNRLYYGLEFLPKEIVGETFNTHVVSISTDMIGVYVNQILIVTNPCEWDGVTFERGVYFAQNEATGFTIHGLRINNFSFNSDITLRTEVDKKLDKNTIFVGTREEYNDAFNKGKIYPGTIVFITDED